MPTQARTLVYLTTILGTFQHYMFHTKRHEDQWTDFLDSQYQSIQEHLRVSSLSSHNLCIGTLLPGNWDSYSSMSLVETYKERHGNYPESVIANKIYRNRDTCSTANCMAFGLTDPNWVDPRRTKKNI